MCSVNVVHSAVWWRRQKNMMTLENRQRYTKSDCYIIYIYILYCYSCAAIHRLRIRENGIINAAVYVFYSARCCTDFNRDLRWESFWKIIDIRQSIPFQMSLSDQSATIDGRDVRWMAHYTRRHRTKKYYKVVRKYYENYSAVSTYV